MLHVNRSVFGDRFHTEQLPSVHLVVTVPVLILVQFEKVAQLIEALRYKPEGRGFDSQWCHWIFLLYINEKILLVALWPPASNRNDYQEYFLRVKGGRCVRLTTLPPSCVDCHKI
jgi:hypothetical protein